MHTFFRLFVALSLLSATFFVMPAEGVIKIGMLNIESSAVDPTIAAIIADAEKGVYAGVAAKNAALGGIGGQQVQIVNQTVINLVSSLYVLALDQLMAAHPDTVALVLVLGEVVDATFQAKLEQYNLMIIAPISAGDAAYTFSNRIMITGAHPNAQIVAIVDHLATVTRLRRVGLVYAVNQSLSSDSEKALMRRSLASVGIEIVATLEFDGGAPGFANSQQHQLDTINFFSERPDATIIFGGFTTELATFLANCFLNPIAPADMKIYVTSAFSSFSTIVLSQVPNVQPGGRMFTPSPTPAPDDPRLQMSSVGSAAVSSFPRSFTDPRTGFTGYIAGAFAFEVMRQLSPGLTRQRMFEEAMNFRFYKVDDVVYGPYVKSCTDDAARLTELCECNQGGRLITMLQMQSNFVFAATEDSFNIPITTCDGADVRQPTPVTALQVICKPNSTANSNMADYFYWTNAVEGRKAALASLKLKVADMPLRTVYDHTTTAAVRTSANEVLTAAMAFSVFSETTLLDAFNPGTEVPVVDPSFFDASIEDGATEYRRHVIYTHSTWQQEAHAIADMARVTGAAIRIVTPNNVPDNSPVFETLRKSTQKLLGRGIDSIHNFFGGGLITAITAATTTSGANPLIIVPVGMFTTSDIDAVLATARSAPSTTTIVLPMAEAQRWWPALTVNVTATSEHARIAVTTSLPNWGLSNANARASVANVNDTTIAEPITALYRSQNAADTTSVAHPLAIRGFIVTRLLMNTKLTLAAITPQALLRGMYDISVHTISADVTVGPFSTATCVEGSSQLCECNSGARAVNIWSLAQIGAGLPGDPIHRLQFLSCKIDYSQPEESESGLSTTELILVIVGAVAALLLAATAANFFLSRNAHRDASCAPKDASKKFAIVFTDIQSSTTLWARIPGDMGAALDAHNALIRREIARHKGYEVKTIGDAFMVAFKKPESAVEFCEDVQRSLLDYEWGTDRIDATYKELRKEALEDEETGWQPGNDAETLREGEAEIWAGLRVRCGIEYDYGEIRFDEVTKAYDYYGSVSNVAARVESVGNGGQVLCTERVMKAIDNAVQVYAMKSLGPVVLHGVEVPTPVFEVDAVPGRTFGQLRTREFVTLTPRLDDKIGGDIFGEYSQEESTNTNEDSSSMNEKLSGTDGGIPGLLINTPSSGGMANTPLGIRGRVDSVSSRGSQGSGSQQERASASGIDTQISSTSAEGIRDVLTLLLSVLPKDERRAFLKKMTQCWRVEIKKKKPAEEEMVAVLCTRLEAISQRRKPQPGANKLGVRRSSFNERNSAVGSAVQSESPSSDTVGASQGPAASRRSRSRSIGGELLVEKDNSTDVEQPTPDNRQQQQQKPGSKESSGGTEKESAAS